MVSSSSTRQPRNPFRMAPSNADKNDPFVHVHPVVKFCYFGAVTALFVAVATLAFSTLNQVASPFPSDSNIVYADPVATHLQRNKNAPDISSAGTTGGGVLPRQQQHQQQPSSQSVPVTSGAQQQQQQRKEAGGVRGQARVVVTSEESNNHNNHLAINDKRLAYSPENVRQHSFRPDDDAEEEEEHGRFDEDIVVDQDLLMLQQADPAGANKKILGATKEQVRKEIRANEHHSDYHDFGHDSDNQDDTHSHNNRVGGAAAPDDDQERTRQSSQDDEESKSSGHRVHVIRRKGEAPVKVSGTTSGATMKQPAVVEDDEQKLIHSSKGNASAPLRKRSAPIRISSQDEENDDNENDENRPVVLPRKRAAPMVVPAAEDH